jgi:hypothetical protein
MAITIDDYPAWSMRLFEMLDLRNVLHRMGLSMISRTEFNKPAFRSLVPPAAMGPNFLHVARWRVVAVVGLARPARRAEKEHRLRRLRLKARTKHDVMRTHSAASSCSTMAATIGGVPRAAPMPVRPLSVSTRMSVASLLTLVPRSVR